jgi:hypothetical protein
MKSIDEILEEFLEAQKNRLKERTFRNYEDIIFLFKTYLNGYGYMYLDEDKGIKWKAAYEKDEEAFTKLFGQEELGEYQMSEFLDYFMIRKVMASESHMKNAVRVMKKFSKWLTEQYDSDVGVDLFEEAEDLPKMQKLAELIFDHAQRSPEVEYEQMTDSSFIIDKIGKGKLWVEDDLNGGIAGPVLVTKEISALCKEGWRLNMVIGKTTAGWHILVSGNVYPY